MAGVQSRNDVLVLFVTKSKSGYAPKYRSSMDFGGLMLKIIKGSIMRQYIAGSKHANPFSTEVVKTGKEYEHTQ